MFWPGFSKWGPTRALYLQFHFRRLVNLPLCFCPLHSSRHIMDEKMTGMMMAVVALTMALTPLMIILNEKLILPHVGIEEAEEQKEPDRIEEKNPVIIAGFGRYGNIVGRFLKANGIVPTVLEIDSDRVELLRKLGLKAYYGDATRDDLLKAAGADDAKLIIIALDSPEKCLELVETVKKHFQHLHVLVRAQDRPDAYELMDAGVLHLYRETFDSSLRMGVDALATAGTPFIPGSQGRDDFQET